MSLVVVSPQATQSQSSTSHLLAALKVGELVSVSIKITVLFTLKLISQGGGLLYSERV